MTMRKTITSIGLSIVSVLFASAVQGQTPTLVSINRTGTNSGNSGSDGQVTSANGRFVAFESLASDLVANDSNGLWDVFVRDLQTSTTTLVSINSAGTGGGNQVSGAPVISADGRFVAFVSEASNLVTSPPTCPPDNLCDEVFVRDLQLGTTTLVSVNRAGTDGGNANSGAPVISADGRFVAFVSYASDLVANDNINTFTSNVFVRDLQTSTTTLGSVNSVGTDGGNGNSVLDGIRSLTISADGRVVAFDSLASDLVANDTNGTYDVFVRNLQTNTTTLVSLNSAGTDSGAGESDHLVMSADGRFVAFQTRDGLSGGDVFVRDRQTNTTTLVSINRAGTRTGSSYYPVISADGRFVAFWSDAGDLVANDTNGTYDVFVRALQTNKTRLVSVNSAGTDSGNNESGAPVISADGRVVTFRSRADDLVATDTNGMMDVFAKIGNTPAGTNVSADLNGGASTTGGASVTFTNVTAPGDTTMATSTSGPTLPSGFQLGNPPTYFDISTIATFTGSVTICINYTGITFTGNENSLKLLHFETGAWRNATVSQDTANNIICASVTSFSPFVIVQDVQDTVAPTVTSTVTRSQLSPPTHDLVNVDLAVSATDNSGVSPTITVTVFGDEDDQEPTARNEVFSPDAKNIAPTTLRLRAERKDTGDGRVYLIVVKAVDGTGNTGFKCVTVVVPKGTDKKSIDSANAQAAAARTFCLGHGGSAPTGYVIIGDGPVVGSKQ
jgi:hypothetical protein